MATASLEAHWELPAKAEESRAPMSLLSQLSTSDAERFLRRGRCASSSSASWPRGKSSLCAGWWLQMCATTASVAGQGTNATGSFQRC